MGQVSAADFLQTLSQVIFVLIFLFTVVQEVRRPTRANLDIALFFGVAALTIAATWIDEAFRLHPSALVSDVSGALAMALPYLLLRLADDFSGVPRLALRLAEAGLIAIVIGLLLLPTPLPLSFVGALVVYFVALSFYDAVAFIRGARQANGVTKRRLQAIAAGTIFLGVAILIAGIEAGLPVTVPVATVLVPLVGLIAALAYYVGFVPPAWLRRSWQAPEFRSFVRETSRLPGLAEPATLQRAMEQSAANAVGAPNAVIQTWDPDAKVLRFSVEDESFAFPLDQTIGGRAFLTQEAIFARHLARASSISDNLHHSLKADAALIAPITTSRRRYGVLVVYAPRDPIFADDDLGLVQLLADQVGVILENRMLVDEAIAERARAEALASAEAERRRLYALFMQAPALIAVLSGSQHVFELVNPMYLQLTGRSDPSQLVGKPIRDGLPELAGQGFYDLLDQVYQSGEKHIGTGVPVRLARGKNGQLEETYFNFVYLPRRNLVGTIDGILIHAVDVTGQVRARQEVERKSVEIQELNAALEQRVVERTAELRAAMAELESFSYSVSHDLRAPLRTIDGFSLALQEDYAATLGPDGQDYLDRIRAASQRMGELIDGLLRLSRVTRSELRWERVDLSAMARGIAAELQRTQPDRPAAFSIQEGLVATGDSQLLRVVLDNLLGNAWKFTAKRNEARIEFSASEEDRQTTYVVRDNGAGFDMAFAGKLFGPFQRLHGMTEFEGTGIGLATVQRIINRHGGRIWAEGAVEGGASFFFSLGA